jgi:hypothetical protein
VWAGFALTLAGLALFLWVLREPVRRARMRELYPI